MKNNFAKKQDTERKVLIIEQDKVFFYQYSSLLENAGYEVYAVSSTMNGLEIAIDLNIDIILMDLRVGKQDGYDLINAIASSSNLEDIPVLLIDQNSEDTLGALELGAVDYIGNITSERELLAKINTHAAVKKKLDSLRAMAITDKLTGNYNRRFAYEILAKQVSFSKRYEESFVVVFIDINNLKLINDNFGHTEGDKLIVCVSSALNEAIRKTDYLFRMGGDEFLIIFTRTKPEAATIIVERLRSKLNTQSINNVTIDFSFGVNEYNPADNVTEDQLIQLADYRMYTMKQKIKDQRKQDIRSWEIM